MMTGNWEAATRVQATGEMMTGTWEAGTGVQAPGGEQGIVVVTRYRSNVFFHPGEPVIVTVDVLFDGTGQVITYRARTCTDRAGGAVN